MSTPGSDLGLARRLAGRLFPAAVGIAVAISLGVPATYYAIESAALRRIAAREAGKLAEQIGGLVDPVAALWKYRAVKHIQDVARSLTERGVTSIRASDEAGVAVAASGHEAAEAGRWWSRPPALGSAPIHYNNHRIGEVRVGLSRDGLLGVTLALFALSSTTGIALAVFVYRFPVRIVGKMEGQIEDLVRTVRREKEESEYFKTEAEAAAQRFRELVQSLDAIVWEADPATLRYTFVSQRAEAILGYPTEPWLAQADFWVAHLHPEDRERAVAAHSQAAAGGQSHSCEYRMLAADGRTVWVHDAWGPAGEPSEEGVRLRGVMVDVTVLKQTEAALRTRTTQLDAVRTISTEIARELDLTTLLALIVRRATELVGVDSGALFLWDDARQQLTSEVHLGAFSALPHTPVTLGQGVVGRVAAYRHGLIVNDYRAWPGAYPNALAHEALTAVLGEPLLYRDRFVGVIDLARSHGEGTFSEEDAALLRLFAIQAAIAIENARLHERLTIRLKRQQALARLSRLVSSSLDVDAVLREIVRAAAELMGPILATFWAVDEAGRTLELRAYSAGKTDDHPRTLLRFGEGGVGWVAEHRQSLYVPDRYADARFVAQDWARKQGFVSFLGIPVLLGDSLLAVLALNGRQPFRLDLDDQSLLDTFVAQAAIALKNARLFDTAQREIADRTRAEEALRASERQLALAIEGSGVGLLDWHIPTGETVFNTRWAEIVGYGLDELAPSGIQVWTDLAHPEDLDKLKALLQQHFTGTIPVYESETRMRHRDGHWVWVLARGKVTEWDAEGKAVRMNGTLLDITARKQLEEERLIRGKLEATGIMAGGIAHDFNNLLTVILGNLELMGLPGMNIAPHLQAAQQATLAAHGLTQQFLTFAPSDGPIHQTIALAGLLRDAVGLALRGGQVECDFSLPPDLWPIQGDTGQLGQAIRNLALNAREASPADGRIAVRAENVPGPPRAVRVSIVDAGCGVPLDILPRIFDPYFSTKQRGGQRGMGLGLTVARAVVEKHGGTLTLGPAPGAGTIVEVTLPAAPPIRPSA